MKKMMAILIALVLVVALLPISVSARTLTADEQELLNSLRVTTISGEGVTFPAHVLTEAENYLAALDTPLTAAQISQIETHVANSKTVAAATNETDSTKWSAEAKNTILAEINSAAQVIGLSAVANSASGASTGTSGISILNATGQPIVVNDRIIKTTGFGVEAFVIAGLCGIAVLSACVFVSKKVELF